MHEGVSRLRYVRRHLVRLVREGVQERIGVSIGMQVLFVRIHRMKGVDPRRQHVAIGGIAGAVLSDSTSPVVVASDNLLLGPANTRASRHRDLRAAYWGKDAPLSLPKALARSGDLPICVWLPPTPNALLILGQIAARALKRERKLFVVDLSSVVLATPPRGLDPGPAPYVDAATILPSAPPPRMWSKRETESAAELWRLWCLRSPTRFSKRCTSGEAQSPALANLGRIHAGTFPTYAGSKLSLSRLDELLLQQLSPEWRTPAEVFSRAIRAEAELDAWLSHLGDLYVARRLREWARHSRGRIVERQREPLARLPVMKRWSFRWAPGGEAILDALPSVSVAPPVFLGGAVAYDPAHGWVSRVDAAGTSRIRRLRSP